jgi:hypothetical protein
MTDAPDPRADPNLLRTFEGYRAALATMDRQELLDQLTRINAALETQSRAAMTSSLLSDSLASSDQLQTRSLPTASRPSPDRGSAASLPSTPLPSAVDLLARSKSLAPRIAAKLVQAEARRVRRERG